MGDIVKSGHSIYYQNDVMKKYGPNTENLSHAALRLGTKLWRLRAPLTFLHATSGFEPLTLLPESSALTTRPLRQPLKVGPYVRRHSQAYTLAVDPNIEYDKVS